MRIDECFQFQDLESLRRDWSCSVQSPKIMLGHRYFWYVLVFKEPYGTNLRVGFLLFETNDKWIPSVVYETKRTITSPTYKHNLIIIIPIDCLTNIEVKGK
jgi:hypothetical protein